MQAPKSKQAREILSNQKASKQLVNAARARNVQSIKVNGKTLYLKNAPRYTPITKVTK